MMDWKKELAQRQASIHQSKIKFTVPSQWLRERFFQSHGIKAQFIPNTIRYTPQAASEIPSQRYILFVANNADKNPYKDFETLKKSWIEANSELKDRQVDLVCVGGSAKEEQVRNGRLIVLSNRDNSEILELMRNARFVVQASKQDNAPLTILEAHSVSKPIVASLVGGIPEMLTEKELDVAFEAENSHQLKDSLVKAVRESDNGTFTYRFTESHAFRQMVDAYLGLYLETANA